MVIWILVILLACLSGWGIWNTLRVKRRLGRLERQLESHRREQEAERAGLKQRLRHLGRLLVRVSQGRAVSEAQALEARPFEDITGEKAWQLLDTHRRVTILDVRDPHEYAAGHIPGALFIPLNQLEKRWREVPRDADFVIIHCTAGSRSAAACEYLSREHGYLNLYNLVPGLSDWPGPVETGGQV